MPKSLTADRTSFNKTIFSKEYFSQPQKKHILSKLSHLKTVPFENPRCHLLCLGGTGN